MTIDVDFTICQVYGTRKQGAELGHTKVRGYHAPLAFAAGTWDLLGARLRGGSACTGRGRPALSPRRSAGCAPRGPTDR